MSKKQIGLVVAFCIVLACIIFFITPIFAKKSKPVEAKEETLSANRVYVMYVETCPMCKKALDYLDKNEANNPYIVRVDLATENGKSLLKQCRKKFGFKDVVIPLICADKEFLMGWSGSQGQKVSELSKAAAAN